MKKESNEYNDLLNYLDSIKIKKRENRSPHKKIEPSCGEVPFITLKAENIENLIYDSMEFPSYFFVDEIVCCVRKSYILRKNKNYQHKFSHYRMIKKNKEFIGNYISKILECNEINIKIKNDLYNIEDYICGICDKTLVNVEFSNNYKKNYVGNDYMKSLVLSKLSKLEINKIMLIYIPIKLSEVSVFEIDVDYGKCNYYLNESKYLKSCLDNNILPEVSTNDDICEECACYNFCKINNKKKNEEKKDDFAFLM